MQSKVHDTHIEPRLRNTIHNPYFITTRLVSQVIIANTKVPDKTGNTDLGEDILKVVTKMYPLTGNSCPKRNIPMSTHMTLVRDGR